MAGLAGSAGLGLGVRRGGHAALGAGVVSQPARQALGLAALRGPRVRLETHRHRLRLGPDTPENLPAGKPERARARVRPRSRALPHQARRPPHKAAGVHRALPALVQPARVAGLGAGHARHGGQLRRGRHKAPRRRLPRRLRPDPAQPGRRPWRQPGRIPLLRR